MKKRTLLSRMLLFALFTIFIFSSCGHYKHKVFTSERDDLVLNVKIYNNSPSHGNSKVKEFYVLHYKDTTYNIKNVKYNPEVLDLRRAEDKAKVSTMVMMAELVPGNEIDSSMLYKDTIYNYMLANPKGKLNPNKEMKYFMYQTHIFLDSLKIVDNKIEISSKDINEVHYLNENRSLKRGFGIGMPIFVGFGGIFAFIFTRGR